MAVRFKLVKTVDGGTVLIKASKMKNLYDHMNRDVETDLVAYIMGLWHMDKIRKQAQNYNGAIKLKGTTK